jgi:hypothetical protein
LILNCAILDYYYYYYYYYYYAASSGNNTEERSSQLLCGGNLKSRTMIVFRPVTQSYSRRLEYLVSHVQNGHYPYLAHFGSIHGVKFIIVYSYSSLFIYWYI